MELTLLRRSSFAGFEHVHANLPEPVFQRDILLVEFGADNRGQEHLVSDMFTQAATGLELGLGEELVAVE